MAAREWLQIRVSEAEQRRIKTVLRRLEETLPVATRASLVRAAFRIGLDALDKDASLAVKGFTVSKVV